MSKGLISARTDLSTGSSRHFLVCVPRLTYCSRWGGGIYPASVAVSVSSQHPVWFMRALHDGHASLVHIHGRLRKSIFIYVSTA